MPGPSLPENTANFASKEYWDAWFSGEGARSAFEWYGSPNDVLPFLRDCMTDMTGSPIQVLHIGCGNSALGPKLARSSVHVTNVDWAEEVLSAAEASHGTRSGACTWMRGDMTTALMPPGSQHAVLDKGALDALAPDEASETLEAVARMFGSIKQQLHEGGEYWLVSLLQEHVLRALMHGFPAAQGWKITVVPFSPHDPSPMLPFFVRIQCSRAHVEDVEAPVSWANADIECDAKLYTTPTLPDASGLPAAGAEPWLHATTYAAVLASVRMLQNMHSVMHKLAVLQVGQRITLTLPAHAVGADAPADVDTPRYSLTILDAPATKPRSAVLLIPQGREHEWMFSSAMGQAQLAQQADYARLVFVTLERGHTFGSVESVQAELNPFIADLLPKRGPGARAGAAPYLAVAEDLGQRTAVAQGESDICGRWWVEDVPGDEPDESVRHLVFSSNRHAVQTAVAWRAGAPQWPALQFEYHSAMLCAAAVHGDAPLRAAVAAKSGVAAETKFPVVVLGLGGGALPGFFSVCAPWAEVHAVEIDPAVVDIARTHFALPSDVHVHCADAAEVLHGLADGTSAIPAPALLCMDLDSKDLSQAMSFPPAGFAAPAALDALAAAVQRGGGVAAVNVAARESAPLIALGTALSDRFAHVAVLPGGDDAVNVVILAWHDGPGLAANVAALRGAVASALGSFSPKPDSDVSSTMREAGTAAASWKEWMSKHGQASSSAAAAGTSSSGGAAAGTSKSKRNRRRKKR